MKLLSYLLECKNCVVGVADVEEHEASFDVGILSLVGVWIVEGQEERTGDRTTAIRRLWVKLWPYLLFEGAVLGRWPGGFGQ